MPSNRSNGAGDHPLNGQPEAEPHERYLELAAVSTTGDLTPEEQKLLREHLAVCPKCREALREFEVAANVCGPMLAAEFDSESTKEEKPVPFGSSRHQGHEAVWKCVSAGSPLSSGHSDGISFSRTRGYLQTHANWNYVWLPLAATVLLTAALGIYSYRAGKRHGLEIARSELPRSNFDSESTAKLEALEQQLSDAGHEREILQSRLRERDSIVSGLRRRIQEQNSILTDMQTAQANLENSIRVEEAGKQQAIVQERDSLKKDLSATETSLRAMQSDLASLRQRQSDDQLRAASLETQIKDLNAQLREREQALNKDEELLAHDRDIRDLMGARDLYIAEVYDVGGDGATQKPYGRVFYTRGKSLIFYAYDLDQHLGAKGAKSATFQAWGRRGPDPKEALNLGVFYKDTLGKKRWILKFDDPKTVDQIDAVFVTLEPNGESHRPSGKSFLFGYLKVNPNHP